jgi:toxin FitB
MKYLVDTNVFAELRKGERAQASVVNWAKATSAEEFATSVLVMGEIRRGIELKRRADRQRAAALDLWAKRLTLSLGPRVLPIDSEVAEAWATLRLVEPLPVIDGLLAATAKVYALALVTRNVSDLKRTGVKLLNPFR